MEPELITGECEELDRKQGDVNGEMRNSWEGKQNGSLREAKKTKGKH